MSKFQVGQTVLVKEIQRQGVVKGIKNVGKGQRVWVKFDDGIEYDFKGSNLEIVKENLILVTDIKHNFKEDNKPTVAPIGQEVEGDVHDYLCPHCGVGLDNGYGEHLQEVNDKYIKHDKYQYECLACGGEFGPEIDQKPKAKIKKSNEAKEDFISLLLVKYPDYYQVAKDVGLGDLKLQYGHLNNGQQAMLVRIRLRSLYKKHIKNVDLQSSNPFNVYVV